MNPCLDHNYKTSELQVSQLLSPVGGYPISIVRSSQSKRITLVDLGCYRLASHYNFRDAPLLRRARALPEEGKRRRCP